MRFAMGKETNNAIVSYLPIYVDSHRGGRCCCRSRIVGYRLLQLLILNT